MHLFNFIIVSDNSDENSMMTVKNSAAETDVERRQSRGIWSLAETAASSSRKVSTTTINNSYFQFRPDPSLIPYFSNPSTDHFRLSLNRKYVL